MKLDSHELARLAREVAMAIKPPADILKEFDLTQQEYDVIAQLPFYKHALDTMLIEWNKPHTTEQRIELKSKAFLEDNLVTIGGRARDPTEPLTAQIEAMKFLYRTAGMERKDQHAVAPTDRFVITINLGADVEHYDKPIAVEKPEIVVNALPAAKGD